MRERVSLLLEPLWAQVAGMALLRGRFSLQLESFVDSCCRNGFVWRTLSLQLASFVALLARLA